MNTMKDGRSKTEQKNDILSHFLLSVLRKMHYPQSYNTKNKKRWNPEFPFLDYTFNSNANDAYSEDQNDLGMHTRAVLHIFFTLKNETNANNYA